MAWYEHQLVGALGFPLVLTLVGIIVAHLLDRRQQQRLEKRTNTEQALRVQRALALILDEVVRTVKFVAGQATAPSARKTDRLTIEGGAASLWPDLKETILTSGMEAEAVRDFSSFFGAVERAVAESERARRGEIEAAEAAPGDGQRLRQAGFFRAQAHVHLNAFMIVQLGERILKRHGTDEQREAIASSVAEMNKP